MEISSMFLATIEFWRTENMDNPNDAGIYFSKNCINYKTIWTLRENERVWPDLREERKKERDSVPNDLHKERKSTVFPMT